MKIFLVTIFLLAGLSVGRSQEIDPDSVKIFPIHEVVISATRTQIPLRDSPSSVNVINRQSIERSNGTTLADVLKSEGGVFIKEYGANSSLKTISLRGSASEHVLVLMNGNRYNSFQNGLVDLNLLPLDDIERVEIVHGGNSALYGADALGGVINIFTRRPSNALQLHAETSFGSFGYERYTVNGETRMGQVGFRLGYDAERGRDDFPYTVNSASVQVRTNSDFIRRQLYFNTDAALDQKSSCTISFQNIVAERGVPGAIGPYVSELARQSDHDVNVLANYSDAHIDRVNISVRSGLHYSLENYDDPNPVYPIHSYYKNMYANITTQVQYLMNSSQQLLGGIDFEQGRLDGNDFDSRILRTQKAVYVSSETHLTYERDFLDRFSFYGTLRYDHVSSVDHAVTPKIGFNIRLFQPGDVRLRASAGKSFRSPTLNDLYYRGFSNPTLAPEHSTSIDAGLFASMVLPDVESDFDLSTFYLDTKDRIYFDGTTFRPENIGRVESHGLELKYTGRFLHSLITAEVGQTITDAIKKNPTTPGDATVGNQLVYIPTNLTHFSLSLHLLPVTITVVHTIVGNRFVDDANMQELPSYHLTNANVVVSQLIGEWRFFTKGEVNNMFDTEYQVFKDYPMPKINVRLTVGVEYTR